MIDDRPGVEAPTGLGSGPVGRAAEFAAAELVGRDEYFDRPLMPHESLYERFADAGLANWWLSDQLGGLGVGLEASVDIVSALAYGDAGTAFTLFISILGSEMVWLHGSDTLRADHLVPMVGSARFCATLGSEREAGSELLRMGTLAERDGDEVVIDGDKFISANAGFADFLVVIARSGGDEGGHVAVLVPRDTPGVRIVRRWDLIGLRSAATYQVELRSCRVPAANLLRGHGVRLLESTLNASRILVSACAVGIARRIRDLALEYAETKSLKGAALSGNSVFAAKLGQMDAQIEVMRNQCHAAAREYDSVRSRPDAAEWFRRNGALRSALTTKLFCGQTGWAIAGIGSELFGGLGYTEECAIGKLVRDMRYVSVVEGGDDVLRDIIYSRHVVPVGNRA